MISTGEFIDALRTLSLLERAKIDELVEHLQEQTLRASTPAQKLAEELVAKSWLTPYQAEQLLECRAADLVLGPYVVLDCLGKGGMGAVLKARHRKLDRIDAVKVVRNDYLRAADAAERFDREARGAAQLRHPNVVLVYDAAEADGVRYLAMEYVEGIDLAKLVQRNGPLPISLACAYVQQTALGLQHIHERGLVHRDIKPSNLLLQQAGGGEGVIPVVKILDLGLVRFPLGSQGEGCGTLTESQAMMGTPDFLAPEQALDAHKVDVRADLYSLGCTFYYLLTGEVPFPGGVFTQKLVGHQMRDPTPVELHRPETPTSVAAVVRKLMAKKPEERYQAASELVDELARIRAGLPGLRPASVPAPRPLRGWAPGTRTPKARPSSHESRGGRGLVLGIVTLLAVGTGGWLVLAWWAHRLAVDSSVSPDSTQAPPLSVLRPPATVESPHTRKVPSTAKPPPATQPTSEELPATLTIDLGSGVKLEMVRIDPGDFWMGSPDEEIDAVLRHDKSARREDLASETPQHKVQVTRPFYLGKFEVTQEQYQRVTGKTPSRFCASGDGKAKVEGLDTRQFPVESVSWEDAMAFCQNLTKQVGAQVPEQLRRRNYLFLLPTEVQWEYACRAGTRMAYHFGDKLDGNQANCDGRYPFGTGEKGRYHGRPSKVGEYATPNAWGLHDMHGNVWEWCADAWDPSAFKKDPDRPSVQRRQEASSRHVLRGGGWLNVAGTCRAAHRAWLGASDREDYVGLRVALRENE
jgi:serine/threonine-protein kinase